MEQKFSKTTCKNIIQEIVPVPMLLLILKLRQIYFQR
jgi:hypothetical protein